MSQQNTSSCVLNPVNSERDDEKDSQTKPLSLSIKETSISGSYVQNLTINNVFESSRDDNAQVKKCDELASLAHKRIDQICSSYFDCYADRKRAVCHVQRQLHRCNQSDENSHSSEGDDNSEETLVYEEIKLENIFNAAVSHAEEEAKELNDLTAEMEHKLVHGNMIGICGPLGIGKTTLAKVIARKILHENLFNCKTLFYLQLIDIDYNRNTTLLKLLLSSLNLRWKHEEDKDNEILTIIDQSKDVVIIMDGLQDVKFTKSSSKVNMYDSALPEVFIKGILGGLIFPNAKKIITSREHDLYKLHYSYRPWFVLHLFGLSEESLMEVCKNVCCQNAQRCFDWLTENKTICSLCSNPFYLVLCFHCIKKSNNKFPSCTETFARIFDVLLKSDHLSSDFNVLNIPGLSKLACRGLLEKKSYFTDMEINEANLDQATISAFFSVKIGTKFTGGKLLNKTWCFFDKTMQELLASIYLNHFASSAELQTSLDLLQERHETVTLILFGLGNKSISINSIRCIPNQTGCAFSEKINLLKNFACKIVRKALSSSDRHRFKRILFICRCTFEMKNEELAKSVASTLGNHFSLIGSISPEDISAFQYVLQSRSSGVAFQLTVGPCLTFVKNSLLLFFKKIKTTMKKTNLFLPKINLSHTKFTDEEIKAVSSCLKQVESLTLSDCSLTEAHIKILTAELKALPSPNFELSLTYNILDEISVQHLANCMNSLNELHVSNCKLSQQSIDILASAIKSREQPLKHLCIWDKLNSQMIMSAADCVGKIDCLVIGLKHEKNDVQQGIEALSSAIEKLTEPMESLSIQGSHIGDEGVIEIARSVKNLKRLYLGCEYDEGLTLKGIQCLSAAIYSLETPMEEFVLCCSNKYCNEAKFEFASCKCKYHDIRSFH